MSDALPPLAAALHVHEVAEHEREMSLVRTQLTQALQQAQVRHISIYTSLSLALVI
jgi:hypothetical protein